MKHAFMIMAHSNWSLLCRLLRRLDYKVNNIYNMLFVRKIGNDSSERERLLDMLDEYAEFPEVQV